MRHRLSSLAPAMLLFVLFSGAAQAHPGHDVVATFWSGLLHPLTGLDHLLAMLAIGLWSAFRAPRPVLQLPLLFVAGAALGTCLGLAGVVDGRVEIAVAASLIPLGAALLMKMRAGRIAALIAVALCGLLHGGANGRELAQGLSTSDAFAGFLFGTALLHGLGAALMLRLPAARRSLVLGAAGGGLGVAGVWMLA